MEPSFKVFFFCEKKTIFFRCSLQHHVYLAIFYQCFFPFLIRTKSLFGQNIRRPTNWHSFKQLDIKMEIGSLMHEQKLECLALGAWNTAFGLLSRIFHWDVTSFKKIHCLCITNSVISWQKKLFKSCGTLSTHNDCDTLAQSNSK